MTMSPVLRVEMIISALVVLIIVVRNVNHKRMRIQYSFLWLLISLVLLLFAIFPGIVFWLCSLTGIEVPSNLLYLLGIFALLFITFHQTVLLSRQADQIKYLTQIVSLEKYRTSRQESREETGRTDQDKQ